MTATSDGRNVCSASNLCAVYPASTSASIACGAFSSIGSGVELRHKINVDGLIWGSDFPHQESDWPESMSIIERNFAGVPEPEKYKMVCGNAIEFFHLGAGLSFSMRPLRPLR